MSPSKEDIIWLAAMFEGEGTTGLFKTMRGTGSAAGKWRISTYFLIVNNDPIIVNEVIKILESMGIGTYLHQRERPESKDWALNYQVGVKNMLGVHKVLENILPYVRGNKRAVIEMTMRFIESRNFGKPDKGPGSGYSDEDWKTYEAVKRVNRRGRKREWQSSETLRQALGDIEKMSGEDKVQTSMKVGEAIEE